MNPRVFFWCIAMCVGLLTAGAEVNASVWAAAGVNAGGVLIFLLAVWRLRHEAEDSRRDCRS